MKSFDKDSVFIKYFDSKDRYYNVTLSYDLLGDLVLLQSWGGKLNSRGGSKKTVVSNYDEGFAIFDEITKQRIQRGYSEKIQTKPFFKNKLISKNFSFKKRFNFFNIPDLLCPKLFVQMLIRFQKTIPHFFHQKYIKPDDSILAAIYRYPEYYPVQVENFLKQWLRNKIFIVSLFSQKT